MSGDVVSVLEFVLGFRFAEIALDAHAVTAALDCLERKATEIGVAHDNGPGLTHVETERVKHRLAFAVQRRGQEVREELFRLIDDDVIEGVNAWPQFLAQAIEADGISHVPVVSDFAVVLVEVAEHAEAICAGRCESDPVREEQHRFADVDAVLNERPEEICFPTALRAFDEMHTRTERNLLR